MYFAGFIIVSVFIIVFNSSAFTLLYASTNQLVDNWKSLRPDLYLIMRQSVHQYWQSISFN
jgi:hypothetical protein